MGASKREIVSFIEERGWKWDFINPPEPKPKTHFNYGFIKLMRPSVRVER